MPVFGVDGITDGEMAENALLHAGIDMVDVGRGFLVNPAFGNDILEGKELSLIHIYSRAVVCGRCENTEIFTGYLPSGGFQPYGYVRLR